MARPKKTTTRKSTSTKKSPAKKTTATRGRKSSTTKTKSSAKQSKGLQKTPIANPKTGAHIGGMSLLTEHLSVETRRPPNNPDVPEQTIVQLNNLLNDGKAILDNYTQHLRALDRCRKARGFSAGSLRFAQTPHINSWSFAKGSTERGIRYA